MVVTIAPVTGDTLPRSLCAHTSLPTVFGGTYIMKKQQALTATPSDLRPPHAPHPAVAAFRAGTIAGATFRKAPSGWPGNPPWR